MSKRSLKVFVLLAAMALAFAPAHALAKEKKAAPAKLTAKAVDLKLALRDLWVGHIFWVRNVVVMTKMGDSEGAKVAEGKAVDNAKAIANAVAPFYGQKAADKLFDLLAGHYGAIKEYMSAAYAGNKEAQDAASDKLKKNGDEIASFLSGANPKNWPKAALSSALMTHVTHHMAQIDQINAKDYTAEAATWDAMKNHIYVIAGVLSDGLVKQFPKKF